MTWDTEKQQLNERKEYLDTFDTNAIRSLSQTINQSINKYVNTAGISSNPNENTNYVEANKNFSILVDKQKGYLELLHSLSNISKFYIYDINK